MTKSKILFFGSIVLFIVVNVATLYNSHGLDDDFSQYLKHAQNIVEHKAYRSDIGLEPGVICPPGYPLLLAPLMKCFGLNFTILKIPNLFYWLIYVIVLYRLWKKRLGEGLASLLAVFFLTSPFFFLFKQQLLSDLPFLSFLTIALYLFNQYDRQDAKDKRPVQTSLLWAAMSTLVVAFLIRPAAIVLYLTVLIYFLFIKKNTKLCLAALLSLAMALIVLQWVGFSFSANFSEVTVSARAWYQLSFFRIQTIFSDLWAFFVPSILPDNARALIFETYKMQRIVNIVNILLPLGILFVFIHKLKNKTISLLGCFFAVYYFAIVVWWIPGPGRYILPLVGLIPVFFIDYFTVIYKFVFCEKLKIFCYDPKKIVLLTLIILIVNNVVCVGANYQYKEDGVSKTEFLEMVGWVKTNTPRDAHFMSYRPRPLGFFTDRLGTKFNGHPDDESLTDRIQRLRVKYLIIFSGHEDVLQMINPHVITIHEVWKNSEYKIFFVE